MSVDCGGAEDKHFATKIQNGVFRVIRSFDSTTRDGGFKEARFGVLNDAARGNTTGGHCRAWLQEVAFLDDPAIDVLLEHWSKMRLQCEPRLLWRWPLPSSMIL